MQLPNRAQKPETPVSDSVHVIIISSGRFGIGGISSELVANTWHCLGTRVLNTYSINQCVCVCAGVRSAEAAANTLADQGKEKRYLTCVMLY